MSSLLFNPKTTILYTSVTSYVIMTIFERAFLFNKIVLKQNSNWINLPILCSLQKERIAV